MKQHSVIRMNQVIFTCLVIAACLSAAFSAVPAQVMALAAAQPTATPVGNSESQTPQRQDAGTGGAEVLTHSSRVINATLPTMIQPAMVQPQTPGWNTIMTEGFEGTFPYSGWTLGDQNLNGLDQFWGATTYKPHTGSFSAWPAKGGTNGYDPSGFPYYPNNMSSWMIYGPFDLSNATAADLTFSYWNNSETDYDYFGWYASVDGTNFYGDGVSGNSGGWVTKTFNLANVFTLGNATGHPSVYIAFVFESDEIYNYLGPFVDDIVLRKFVIGPTGFNKISPANGAVNQIIPVTLNWDGSLTATSYQYCVATTNPCSNWTNNDFQTSVTLSNLLPNTTYFWNVRALNADGITYANASETNWNFKTNPLPSPFNKTAPGNGAIGVSLNPTFTWDASAAFSYYQICYGTTNPCSNWITLGTNSTTASGLLPNTVYYWNVRALNANGITYANGSQTDWSFTTATLPGSFGKIAPANGAANQLANLTLSWGASSGATSYDYCYAKTNPCSNWASAGTATSKALTGLTAGSTYYWNVRAVNANGFTYANASATNWSFTTGALPAAFAKIAPSNNATNQPSNPVLSWGASTGAEQYAYCIGIATPCTVWSVIGTNLSTTVNGLAPATTYYWQIRATNSFGTVYANGSTTATWSFTTPALEAPALTYLTPAQVQAGSAGFTMTIIGANFTPFVDGAEVLWDGVARTTTFVSPTELLVDIPAADVATVDSVSITVRNPDLTVSNALTFNVYTFADVLPGVWSYRYVEGFFAKGITTGCNVAPFRYCPDRAVTRAEMAVFLLRSIHSDALPYTPNPAQTGVFADVPVTGKEWMQPWIEEFYGDGYTTGCGYSGSTLLYCPERQVTRAEMAVFVLRAIHGASYQPPAVTVSSFSDVPVAGKEWMMPWMEEFYVEGLTTGCRQAPSLQYCPEQSVNRAEMATFLDRAFSFPQLP